MTPIRRLSLVLLLALLGGCAGRGDTRADIHADGAASDTSVAVSTAVTTEPGALAPVTAEPGSVAVGADPADHGLSSFEALDPWQGYNRKAHAFNMTLDRIILRPIAKGYATVTPTVVRTGVSNFFGNLQQPVSTLNLLLQGKGKDAGKSLGRFLLNLTLGLGGLLDVATQAGIPDYSKDFGQTFAAWGWGESRYLVLPIFGPGTVRDGLGKGVNTTVSPISWFAEKNGAEYSVLYGVDARARALPAEAFLKGAPDEYLLIRDAYLQRRRCQVTDCSEDVPDYLNPDYEFEIPDFDTLRR